VCQRYIDAPLLYRGRKFDLRVLVAVRAFAPRLEALTWHDTFVRAANHAYTRAPAALGDFQTQFTSMRQARTRKRERARGRAGACMHARMQCAHAMFVCSCSACVWLLVCCVVACRAGLRRMR
jgi:hypothetical protein